MKIISHHLFNSPLDLNHEVKVPWKWMPTLYLFKGLTFVMLFYFPLVIFKRMGVDNGAATFFIAWLMLPVAMRPVLSIFVQTGHRNRLWILLSEALIVLSMAGMAYALNGTWWLEGSLMCLGVMAFAHVFHDIAIDKFSLQAIKHHRTSSLQLFKLTFYLPSMLVVLGIIVMIGGNLEVITRNIRSSWSTACYCLSGLLVVVLLWHIFMIPQSGADDRERKIRVSDMFYACLNTSADLIRTPSSWPGILFLSMFLLPCTLLTPVSIQFMLDLGSSGGLALSPQEFGYVQGTVAVFGLIIGGMLGIWLLRKVAFGNALPLMAFATCIPPLFYIYLSYALPANIGWIACCAFVSQVACGFGSCAYLHYLAYYSEVKRVSTYALCMSLVTVSVMIPMMLSGSLQQALGYRRFFILTTLLGVCTLITSALVMVDKELTEEENKPTEKKTIRQ